MGILAAGCAPSARIYVAPADLDRISETRRLIERHEPRHGRVWVNQENELCLVFTDNASANPDSLAESFDLSLVLADPPAGTTRHYPVDRRTMRALIHKPDARLRYGSYEGVVRVWFDEHDERILHGRFRILANEQDYAFWRGWTGNRKALFIGEFDAGRDQELGPQLLQRTEVGQMKRGPAVGKPIPVTGPPIGEPDEED